MPVGKAKLTVYLDPLTLALLDAERLRRLRNPGQLRREVTISRLVEVAITALYGAQGPRVSTVRRLQVRAR